MKPVLTFFLDALKPESLQYMPFLNSFPHQRRMRSEFGHSVTCHPSMYSGVHPNKHKQWFVWKYDPPNSPFQWARIFKYFWVLDNLGSRYFLHKYTRQFRESNTAWFGIPLLVNLPMKYWPYFNVVEDRSWDEKGYLKEFPTIFDILRENQVSFEVIGMTKGAGDEFAQIGNHEFSEIQPWTYFFLGSIDSYSHKFKQDGPETIERMRALDQLIETKYNQYKQRVTDFDVFVFSDHGHIHADKRLDIHKVFRKNGENLNKYIHLVESNFIRFWFRNDAESEKVRRILESIQEGFILTDEQYTKYNLDMPDNRYGDLVFNLDAPYLFTKTIWGFSRKQQSMHGYLPDYPDSDGVFLSQRPLISATHVKLVDVLPTLLNSLNLQIPDYVDGQVLWTS
jgi:predicted AlkP superfamily pyrophosphatase or phosphodiesterase